MTCCRALPHFAIIGAAKSATTYLAKYLARHPDIAFCNRKEPEFFSHDERFALGLEWYKSLYPPVQSNQKAGEASTSYTRSPQYPKAAQRLAAASPGVKLIYVLRDPVERAYSHFVHRHMKELFPGKPFARSFEEHLRIDPMCVDSSDYQMQIQEYLRYFPRESISCVFYEDVASNPEGVLGGICRFIGVRDEFNFQVQEQRENDSGRYRNSRIYRKYVEPYRNLPFIRPMRMLFPALTRTWVRSLLMQLPHARRWKKALTPPPLTTEVRHRLMARFRESNAWLAEFTGRDLSSWEWGNSAKVA